MSRNGSGLLYGGAPLGFALAVACLASSDAVVVCNQIVRRVFVSVRAMCFGALSCAISLPSESKTSGINAPLLFQHFGQTKTGISASNNGVGFQSSALGKLNRKIFNAINDNFARASLVALLLSFGRPSTILRGVGAVIVNAVNAVSVRTRPHIGDKVQKPGFWFKPSTANGNATGAVVTVKPLLRRIASALHAFPNGAERVLGLFHMRIMACNGIGSK